MIIKIIIIKTIDDSVKFKWTELEVNTSVIVTFIAATG